jgi:hypothetical protein
MAAFTPEEDVSPQQGHAHDNTQRCSGVMVTAVTVLQTLTAL